LLESLSKNILPRNPPPKGETLAFTPPLEGGRGEEKLKERGKKSIWGGT